MPAYFVPHSLARGLHKHERGGSGTCDNVTAKAAPTHDLKDFGTTTPVCLTTAWHNASIG